MVSLRTSLPTGFVGCATEAAKRLVNLLKIGVELGKFSAKEPITLIGHSHGGNVIIEAVNMMVKDPAFKHVPLTQNQYDAIVSFTFNVGLKGLQNSQFLKDLNK